MAERDTALSLTGQLWCALHAAIAPVFNMTQASGWSQENSGKNFADGSLVSLL
jgi:hypothetical protein